MIKFIHILVTILFLSWVVGFLFFDFGAYIHVLFIIALGITIFKIIKEHNLN